MLKTTNKLQRYIHFSTIVVDMIAKSFLFLSLVVPVVFFSMLKNNGKRISSNTGEVELTTSSEHTSVRSFFNRLDNKTLSFEAFEKGYIGYKALVEKGKITNPKYFTLIDFTQPSSNKRLYLINMEEGKIELQTYCSHGRNSGGLYASTFSNTSGSYQSSLGFYLTDNSYKGKFDIALRLEGLEACNSKARERAIVMHGAEYATESFLKKNNNVLGRSLGCPAVPLEDAALIIEKIKEGSCLFIYHSSAAYLSKSKLVKGIV